MECRMSQAAELLKLTSLPIAQVGRAVGYANQLHFSRAFKSYHGMSPREWRRRGLAGSTAIWVKDGAYRPLHTVPPKTAAPAIAPPAKCPL